MSNVKWVNLNGMVACSDHIGYEAQQVLKNNPGNWSLFTSYDYWVLYEDDEFNCEMCSFYRKKSQNA